VVLFADADGATKFEDFEKLESSLKELLKGITIKFIKSFGMKKFKIWHLF